MSRADPPRVRTDPGPAPGGSAESPTQIPPRGWWQVVRRALKESSADHVTMLAGGVAYMTFLALFPAIIAAVTLYGLVADPATVAQQAQALAGLLPQSAQPLVVDQIQAVTRARSGALTIGLVVSLVAALWSASSGVAGLIEAINLAYDEQERRGFLRLRGTALLLTLGAIVFVLVTLTLVAVVPPVLDALPLGPVARVLAETARWVLLVALIMVALGVLYRVAPDRNPPKVRWVSVGTVVATVLWVLGSLVFSLFVNNFGRFGATYGTLAGVVVLLLWLYLTSFVVLFGAEINAEAERQTGRDSTVGAPQPPGRREAVAADDVAGEDGSAVG